MSFYMENMMVVQLTLASMSKPLPTSTAKANVRDVVFHTDIISKNKKESVTHYLFTVEIGTIIIT